MNMLKSDLGPALGALLLFLFLRGLSPLLFRSSQPQPNLSYTIEALPPGWEWTEDSVRQTWNSNRSGPQVQLPEMGTDIQSLNLQAWRNMGLSSAQAALAYRWQEEGWLNTPEKLEKLAVLPKTLKQELKKRLSFPNQNQREMNRKNSNQKQLRPQFLVNMAAADSLDLLKVPGLGPASVGKILNHLRIWGGWADWAEWLHLPGMDSLRLSGIKNSISSLPPPRPKSFTYIWYPELTQLWFLKRKQQVRLLKWRNETGDKSPTESICRELGLSDEEFRWLKTYVK